MVLEEEKDVIGHDKVFEGFGQREWGNLFSLLSFICFGKIKGLIKFDSPYNQQFLIFYFNFQQFQHSLIKEEYCDHNVHVY